MTETNTTWSGMSGKEYLYYVYPLGSTHFKKEPGNYLFAKVTNGSWSPCYVGQTENLEERLSNHEKESCAIGTGATHIHVHLTSGGEVVRVAEEKDLIQKWKPPCNEQI